MGGQTFDQTNKINYDDYEKINNYVKLICETENISYMLPFRLGNKITHGDFDIIIFDTDKFIDSWKLIDDCLIKEIKTIPLFEEKFNLYSKHLLTEELFQIDLLKSWNTDSIEITRAFYSYSFANIFLKRFASLVDRNFKFSYLGLLCTNNKFVIPSGVKYIDVDQTTRLIIDTSYVFSLLDLSYEEFTKGFANEIELLNYFKKSKYYEQIKFKFNSKFKHDYNRLEPFKNLVDSGLIEVEGKI